MKWSLIARSKTGNSMDPVPGWTQKLVSVGITSIAPKSAETLKSVQRSAESGELPIKSANSCSRSLRRRFVERERRHCFAVQADVSGRTATSSVSLAFNGSAGCID